MDQSISRELATFIAESKYKCIGVCDENTIIEQENHELTNESNEALDQQCNKLCI